MPIRTMTPASDCMPIEYGYYWIFDGSEVRPGYYGSSNNSSGPWYVSEQDDMGGREVFDVSHWAEMSKPEAPKKVI